MAVVLKEYRTGLVEGTPVLIYKGACYSCWTGKRLEHCTPDDAAPDFAQVLVEKEELHNDAEVGTSHSDQLKAEIDTLVAGCAAALNQALRADPALAYRGQKTEIEIRCELRKHYDLGALPSLEEPEGRDLVAVSAYERDAAWVLDAHLADRRAKLRRLLRLVRSMSDEATHLSTSSDVDLIEAVRRSVGGGGGADDGETSSDDATEEEEEEEADEDGCGEGEGGVDEGVVACEECSAEEVEEAAEEEGVEEEDEGEEGDASVTDDGLADDLELLERAATEAALRKLLRRPVPRFDDIAF